MGWNLDGWIGTCHSKDGGVRGTVDLRSPEQGLIVVVDGDPCWTARVLQIRAADGMDLFGAAPQDAYLRSDDLIATYEAATRDDFRIQVHYSARPVAGGLECERILSLQTSRLRTVPNVLATSELPGGSLYYLDTMRGGGFVEAQLASSSTELAHQTEGGCVLVRTGGPTSYVEMVPRLHRGGLEIEVEQNGCRTLQYHPFPDRLEKGVLLRSRCRSAFLPREADETVAADGYRSLRDATPPLTL